MDDSVYQTAEIFKVSDFLKSLSAHDFSSQLKSGPVKKMVFGDKGIFSLMFWSNSTDDEKTARWVVIKEYGHVSRELNLVDLLKQFHLFGELTVHDHQGEIIVGNHDTKTELVFSSQKEDSVYLRGVVSVKPFT
jgi:hypothetical protein